MTHIKFNNSLQPKKIITTPQTKLIARSILALKRSFNKEIVIAKPVNQTQEAVATPKMKAVDWVGGKLPTRSMMSTKTNLFTYFSYYV